MARQTGRLERAPKATSLRSSGSRAFTPIFAALRRLIASHAITDRRDDHVNVAGPHPEPAMRSPCSLGRVPTSVTTSSASCASTCPRSWRSCTRSSTSALQTRFGVTSTQAPRGGSLRSCGSRAPCTAPCVSGARPRPCGPVGSGHPCFLRTAGGTGVRGDAEQSPSTEDSSRHPRARSKRPSRSTGGSGTTCGTKDTGPSRVTPAVRPPFVSPSAGLHMRWCFRHQVLVKRA